MKSKCKKFHASRRNVFYIIVVILEIRVNTTDFGNGYWILNKIMKKGVRENCIIIIVIKYRRIFKARTAN